MNPIMPYLETPKPISNPLTGPPKEPLLVSKIKEDVELVGLSPPLLD